MRKGLSVALAVAGLLVSGSALAALDLSQPGDSFWRWDLGTVIQLVIAVAASATAFTAFAASNTWREQLRTQHDLELARKIAVRVERLSGLLHHCSLQAIWYLSLGDPGSDGLDGSAPVILGQVPEFDELKGAAAELGAFEQECRALWGDDAADCFRDALDLMSWCVTTGRYAAAYADEKGGSGVRTLGARFNWVKRQTESSIAHGITFSGEDYTIARRVLQPIRDMIGPRLIAGRARQ